MDMVIRMKPMMAVITLAAVLFSACTSDGGGDCDGPALSPVATSASDRALSCVENVSVNGVQYLVECVRVPGNLLGPELAEGEGYVARSIKNLALGDAVAVQGSLCRGWVISAPPSELYPPAGEALLEQARRAERVS